MSNSNENKKDLNPKVEKALSVLILAGTIATAVLSVLTGDKK